MATLQGAIAELIDAIGAVPGVQFAPDEPIEQIVGWPVAMAYMTDGLLSGNRASQENKSLHNVQIAVLMPLNDLRQCMLTMLPLMEPIVNALITHLNGRTSNNYSTWGNLTWILGPIEWPQGQDMFGYVFTIEGMKIINEIS